MSCLPPTPLPYTSFTTYFLALQYNFFLLWSFFFSSALFNYHSQAKGTNLIIQTHHFKHIIFCSTIYSQGLELYFTNSISRCRALVLLFYSLGLGLYSTCCSRVLWLYSTSCSLGLGLYSTRCSLVLGLTPLVVH